MFKVITKEEITKALQCYVTLYQPVAGWKDVFVARDEDCGNEFVPVQTGSWAYATRIEAINQGLCWAHSEDVAFYLDEVTDEEQAVIDAFMKEASNPNPLFAESFFEDVDKMRTTCYDMGCADGGGDCGSSGICVHAQDEPTPKQRHDEMIAEIELIFNSSVDHMHVDQVHRYMDELFRKAYPCKTHEFVGGVCKHCGDMDIPF